MIIYYWWQSYFDSFFKCYTYHFYNTFLILCSRPTNHTEYILIYSTDYSTLLRTYRKGECDFGAWYETAKMIGSTIDWCNQDFKK